MSEQNIPAQQDHWGMQPILPGAPWSASYFGDLPSGGLRVTQILYWYDCPIMFLADDKRGQSYMVVIIDDVGDGVEYLCLAVSDEVRADMHASPDIEGINDMARSVLNAGGTVSVVLERSGYQTTERVAPLQEALGCIGIGRTAVASSS